MTVTSSAASVTRRAANGAAVRVNRKHQPPKKANLEDDSSSRSSSNSQEDATATTNASLTEAVAGEQGALLHQIADQVDGSKERDREPMQLSYKKASRQGRSDECLPRYPVADTIALILILVNFPNLLVILVHFFFSYRDYVASTASSASIPSPPLAVVLFIDAVVVLFTTIAMPLLRNLVTDTSHVIIGVSLSGADQKLAFPFALLVTFVRQLERRTPISLESNEEEGFGAMAQRMAAIVSRPFRGRTVARDSSSMTMAYIRDAVAIHVFSLGMARLAGYCVRPSSHPRSSSPAPVSSSPASAPESATSSATPSASATCTHANTDVAAITAQQSTTSPDIKEKGEFTSGQNTKEQSVEPKTDLRDLSLWDYLLQHLVHRNDKRYTISESPPTSQSSNVFVSAIEPRQITIGIRTPIPVSSEDQQPKLVMRVNGLLWETNIVKRDVQDLPLANGTGRDTMTKEEQEWTIVVDSLIPKTEYEIVIDFANSDLGRFRLALCTSPKHPCRLPCRPQQQPLSISSTVPPLAISSTAAVPPSGPLSPVTTLEDSISTANAHLEELKATYKRTRKENLKRSQTLQKEVDHLSLRVSNVDKSEQRMQGRILSLQTETRRLQEAIEEMEAERDELIALRDRQSGTWMEQKRKRDAEAAALEDFRTMYLERKSEHERKVAVVEADTSKTRAKADKLSLRRTKIQQDLDRLGSEQDSILLREYEARQRVREDLRNRRMQNETEFLRIMQEMERKTEYLTGYLQQKHSTDDVDLFSTCSLEPI